MTPEILFEVEHLSKSFGGLKAIDDLSFQVSAGSFFSIIGPNGAGKSTVFNCINGLYAPGSIVKLFIAVGSLNEDIITPEKKILSTGSISIQHPYFPDKKSVFKDWKAHGWVDIRDALAVSSNVYFYSIVSI